MKIVAKPIDMISLTENDGLPIPIRFRTEDKNQKEIIITIKKILDCKEERLAGNQMYVYKCQTAINGEHRLVELKYEVGECLWYLFRV